MGRLLRDAALARDINVAMGIVMIGAVAVVVVNLLADLAYAALDPRVELGGPAPVRRAWSALRALGTPGVAGRDPADRHRAGLRRRARCCRPTASTSRTSRRATRGRAGRTRSAPPRLGEDVLTRVLAAGRISLLIGFATALVGHRRGRGPRPRCRAGAGAGSTRRLGRLTDLFLIVPGFVVLIVLSISFESVGVAGDHLHPRPAVVAAALRLTRASALRTRELPYVEAARAAGAGGGRIVRAPPAAGGDARDRLVRGARRRRRDPRRERPVVPLARARPRRGPLVGHAPDRRARTRSRTAPG